MALFGMEMGDANHGIFFAFKGNMTTWCAPPAVYLTTIMLEKCKACVKMEQEIREHFVQDISSTIVPINNTKGDRDITRMVMLLVKWTAELIDKNATPHNSLQVITHKTSGWDPNEGGYQEYLEN